MRRFTMLASLLMVLCLQMAAQTWEVVKVGTSTRKTLTYIPKNVEKSPALVISLHGFNQDPEYQQNQTQWNALADTQGFIVTYPLGNNRMWDTSGMGDVMFVEAVMKDMELKHHVDKNRIYLSGFSMGSWLGYHCLETLGYQIAAFGPVSGVDIGKQPRANRMQHALKGQKLLAQGIALGMIANSKAPCKGKSLTTPIFLNPGTRIFHYIPHYIIPRMLYIPLQTNACCDALSDCQYIAMFCPQRID